MEYTTSALTLSSGSETSEGGIMLFVLSTLVKSEQVRSATVQPWRLLHVRLMLDPPLEKLGVYQRAWNVQKRPQQADPTDITGASKTDQLIKLGAHIVQTDFGICNSYCAHMLAVC